MRVSFDIGLYGIFNISLLFIYFIPLQHPFNYKMDSNLSKPSTQATALMVSPSSEHQTKDLVHTIGTDEMLSAGL